MIKTCKVYCTYFGERRADITNNPTNAQEVLTVFRNNIENDKILDCGVEHMDVIVINNYPNVVNNECDAYLKSINNTTTPYGKIIVHERQNLGASMGAYSYAFDLYGNEYDYWFFCEDDIKVIYPEYFKMIINEFDCNNKLGFLALNLINNEEDSSITYVSGALGASKKEILKHVKNMYGKLPYDTNFGANYAGIGNSEVIFTNCYLRLGYEIKEPIKSDVITLADNWEKFSPHTKWQGIKNYILNNNTKYFCHVGF